MGNSLQDQLLALGLAKDKQEKKKRSPAAASKSRAGGRRENGRKHTAVEMTLEQAYALKRKEEKRQAEQARRKKREEDRRRKQLNSAIRDIVKANRLNRDDAEIARNFMFRGRIRKINVTPDQLKALNNGELGIAYLSGGYHLLSRDHTDQVRQLSADHVPDLVSGVEEEDEFPVPDDLTW
jgi:uncharacterized protein YaiL (DUF2058 family)